MAHWPISLLSLHLFTTECVRCSKQVPWCFVVAYQYYVEVAVEVVAEQEAKRGVGESRTWYCISYGTYYCGCGVGGLAAAAAVGCATRTYSPLSQAPTP